MMQSKMSGNATFYTFSYLLNGAWSLLETAKEHRPGCNFCRLSSALFAAFAVEAHLNHVGEIKLPFWNVVERKISWKDKIAIVAQHIGVDVDYGCRPFQSLNTLFAFRDKLAHGRTEQFETMYQGKLLDNNDAMDPKWLRDFWNDALLTRVMYDAREVIRLLHKEAGFDPESISLQSIGEFAEVSITTAAVPHSQGA